MSLRLKLSLIALVVLVLPWAAWRFVGTTESLLRHGEEQALLDTTDTLARAVSAEGLIPAGRPPGALYAWTARTPVWVDGYGDEWPEWSGEPQHFAAGPVDAADPPALDFTLAHDDDAYYLLFQVEDRNIVYRRTPTPGAVRDDRIRLHLRGSEGERVVVIDTIAPGWVRGREPDGDTVAAVAGEWQETGRGYSVELRVPRTFADDAIGFAVADTDGDGTTHWIGTGGAKPPDALLPVAQRRPKATNRLTRMLPKATRAWLVDRNGWVLARAGEVEPAAGSGGRWLRNLLYRHVLASPLQPPAHRGSLTAQLDGDEVTTALTGNPATAWRGAERGSGVVVSAARPVTDASGRPVGALVAERASEGVLLLTERALVQLLGTILFTVTVALAVLMLFAARLSSRIRRLRDAAAGAVDAEGRVSPALPETDARDELGDLSRSLSRTLEGLREYTRYLRSLASRLSHELRTPLAMVSSSLENLAQEDLDTRSQTYAHRARDGAERLSRILRAMSEATRIEESIRGEEREPLELDALLRNFVDAYRDLRPDRRFEVRIAEGDYRMSGAPELIGQMLDKLVDNAVSFSPRDGWIRLGLRRLPESLEVTVANQGPALPEEMSERLFDSLVSVREPATGGDGTPHLGLGLYVVRLVAEMHGGDVRAANLPNAEGVVFTVTLARRAANS